MLSHKPWNRDIEIWFLFSPKGCNNNTPSITKNKKSVPNSQTCQFGKPIFKIIMIWLRSMQCTCEHQHQLQHHLYFNHKSNINVFCKQKISFKNEPHTHCLLFIFLFVHLSLFCWRRIYLHSTTTTTTTTSSSSFVFILLFGWLLISLSLVFQFTLFSFVRLIVVQWHLYVCGWSVFKCKSNCICVYVCMYFSVTNPITAKNQCFTFYEKKERERERERE